MRARYPSSGAHTLAAPDSRRLAGMRRERVAVLFVLALALLALMWRPLLGLQSFSASDVIQLFPPWVEHAPADFEPANQDMGDTINAGLPAARTFRGALGDGDFPFWDPFVGLGTPLGASLTKPFLSPVYLVELLVPLSYAVGLSALVRLLLLVGGTYLFARELGLRPAAAALGGLAFGLCGFNAAWLGFSQTYVTAFLPVSMLLAERVLRTGSRLAAAGLALSSFALVVGAFPFLTAACFVIVGGYIVVRTAVTTPAAARARPAYVVLAAIATGLGPLLAGAFIVPMAAELRDANLAYYRFPRAGYADALPNGAAWRLLVPNLYGTGNGYFGRINGLETAAWVGTVPSILALSVVVVRRRSAMACAFLGTGLVGLLLTYQTSVWRALQPLPGLATNPTGRLSSVAAFCLAVAAAFALDAWLGRDGPNSIDARRAARVALAGAVVLLLGVAIVWLARTHIAPAEHSTAQEVRTESERRDSIQDARRETAGVVALAIGGTTVLIAARRRVVPAGLAGVIVLAVTGFELVRVALPMYPHSDPDRFLPDAAAFADLPSAHFRVAGVELTGYPNLLEAYGRSDIRAHKFPSLEERALFATLDPVPQPSPTYMRLSPQADFTSPWLPLLGVSRILAPLGFDPIGQVAVDVAADTGGRRVLADGDVVRFEVDGPLTGFGLIVLEAEPEEHVASAGRTPGDSARLRAVVTAADGSRRTSDVGFAALGRLGRVNWMFRALGSGRHVVRVSWSRPPRAPRPVVLALSGDGTPARRIYRPGPLPVVASRDAVVYAVPDPAPEASLYRHWRRASANEAMTAIHSGGINPQATVLVQGAAPRAPETTAVGARPLRVARPSVDRVIVHLPPRTDGGMVVLRDGYARGWRARVDGRRATILRVDALLRGVVVPAGARKVEFEYLPPGWPGAIAISGAGVVAVLVLALAGMRARRRHRPLAGVIEPTTRA